MEFYRYRLYATDKWGQEHTGEYERTGRRNVKLIEDIYSLVKETPKGYWINNEIFCKKSRWVSWTTRKRFAYPTKEEALKSFIRRQEERIRILTYQIKDSRVGLFNAQSKLNEL